MRLETYLDAMVYAHERMRMRQYKKFRQRVIEEYYKMAHTEVSREVMDIYEWMGENHETDPIQRA